MDSSLVAIIAVFPGDSDGGDENDRNGVRRVAWPGAYYAAKLPPPIVAMTLGVSKHLLRPATRGRLKISDHVPIARAARKRRPWSVREAQGSGVWVS